MPVSNVYILFTVFGCRRLRKRYISEVKLLKSYVRLPARQTGIGIDVQNLITEVTVSKKFVTIYGLIIFARRIFVTFTLLKYFISDFNIIK